MKVKDKTSLKQVVTLMARYLNTLKVVYVYNLISVRCKAADLDAWRSLPQGDSQENAGGDHCVY